MDDIAFELDSIIAEHGVPEDSPICKIMHNYISGMSYEGALKLAGIDPTEHTPSDKEKTLALITEGLIEKYHIQSISSSSKKDWKASSWLLERRPSTKEVYSQKLPEVNHTHNTLVISHDDWIKDRIAARITTAIDTQKIIDA